jgi:predicted RNA-binding protein
MCESSVFVKRSGSDNEELLTEDVARVVPEGDQIKVVTLLGDVSKVTGEIEEIDLMAHRIVLREK